MLSEVKPDRIYNLAAQSFVADSFHHPAYTSSVNYNGVLNFLEAIRIIGLDTRFYQASTSEMFGDALEKPQTEKTPFNPVSPYAVSKAAAHYLVKNYRKAYGMHACSGILFNHESELRGLEFVTRKISSWLAHFMKGNRGPVPLGYLDSVRDWGYAPEYVQAMALMMESDEPDDYIVASNTETTIRQFLEWCCRAAGFDVEFDGEGINEKCVEKISGRVIAYIDPKYHRAIDVTYLRGDYSKIKKQLGWAPETMPEELAYLMTEYDLELLGVK